MAIFTATNVLKELQALVSVLAKSRSHRTRLPVVALAALGYFAQPALAQELGDVTVPLQINRPFEQPFMVAWLEFDESRSNYTTKRKPGAVRLGYLPGRLRVAVETIAESPNAYRVRIDTDGDSDLTDETPMSISLDASVKLNVTRTSVNRQRTTLPYILSYTRHPDGQEMKEIFHWRPNYVAKGTLKVGGCVADVRVLDANGDGVFDRGDFSNATSIYIDDGTPGMTINLNDPRVIRRSDGSIEIPTELRSSGKKKWLKGEEIVEVCAGSYLVDLIKPDGSAIILAKTDLRVPKVGETLPQLVMTTLDGQRIDLKSLRGNLTLLDFWASWCRPCVEKFAAVKQMVESYEGSIKVIAINVDESNNLPTAQQVIREYKLTWPHVASGRGENDPLWKVFGSMSNNGMSIPLYVLIDSNGIIRYADNGGEDLSELITKVKESSRSR